MPEKTWQRRPEKGKEDDSGLCDRRKNLGNCVFLDAQGSFPHGLNGSIRPG